MRFGLLLFALCAVALVGMPHAVYAQSASEIQAQIDANNTQLESLQAEIKAFQKQLDTLGVQKNTLQSAINTLSITQKQLATQIQATQNKIASANLKIKELTLSIGDKEETIAADQAAIGKALREMAQGEEKNLFVQLISADSLSTAWQAADRAVQLNRALGDDITELRAIRTELASDRDDVTAAKNDLVKLQNELSLQKRSVDANKAAQQKLLADTKNQESSYQKLIVQKQAAERVLEQELADLGNQLDLIVHPGLLPKVGSGVLSWPFSRSFMLACKDRRSVFGNLFCITQYFGNTPFATANPQIYNNKGHNAIDFGAPIGTPLIAALSGVVSGTGNTDLYRGCYSFGKWVMIEHYNGLSTLYAHLSTIDVAKGQKVSAGQVIGLSGMTGYATGPHLHFGVYATEGTKILTFGAFKGATGACKNAAVPIATPGAYLNPLSYL